MVIAAVIKEHMVIIAIDYQCIDIIKVVNFHKIITDSIIKAQTKINLDFTFEAINFVYNFYQVYQDFINSSYYCCCYY